ncbi:MAG: CBS domain-containing protein [Magnetococcales bacterium]|nr:CBS domain-containing protein [Magnetococcales bacterium]
MRCKITTIIEHNVVTIDQYRTVSESVGIMVDRGVGSIVVTGKGRVVGYFTERDLLTRVVSKKRNPETTLMRDVMTTELVKVPHDATCQHCLDQMQEKGIRHLLVYQDALFVGVVSLRALAERMTRGGGRKDLMVNLVGGLVLLVILSVIGLLVYLVPDMLAIAQRLSP